MKALLISTSRNRHFHGRYLHPSLHPQRPTPDTTTPSCRSRRFTSVMPPTVANCCPSQRHCWTPTIVSSALPPINVLLHHRSAHIIVLTSDLLPHSILHRLLPCQYCEIVSRILKAHPPPSNIFWSTLSGKFPVRPYTIYPVSSISQPVLDVH